MRDPIDFVQIGRVGVRIGASMGLAHTIGLRAQLDHTGAPQGEHHEP